MSTESDSEDGRILSGEDLTARLIEARIRLYRSGATEKDLEEYRSLAQAAEIAGGRGSPGPIGSTGAARLARDAPGRRRMRSGVGLLGAGLAVAMSVAAITVLHPPPTPAPSATGLRFDLGDITLQQRLKQYPSTVERRWQGAAIAIATEKARTVVLLPVPDRFLGREQLLVVRCAQASQSWQAQVFSSTYGQARSLSSSGPCGRIGTMVLPAGSGAVSVHVRGDLPFAAVLLAHPSPTDVSTREPDSALR